MASDARIVFPGNPWPKGHKIKKFVWDAHLDPATGLWFDLHLETARYDAEGKGRETRGESAWKSPIVWNNYGRCSMSSTKWGGNHGFLAATEKKPLRFAALPKTTFRVDRDVKKWDGEDCAFHIYLLGHDGVAAHEIRFARRLGPLEFSVAWRGRATLAYAGRYDFAHRFEATVPRTKFRGVRRPDDLDSKEARKLLDALVPDVKLPLA